MAELNATAPDLCRELLEHKRLAQKHRQRLAWASLITHTLVGQLSGLVALSIVAIVACRAIDNGAATQAATIVCTGAATIVAVFVTRRVVGGRTDRQSESTDTTEELPKA
ncbi:hypothetical protein AB0H76_04530 [Nocardia sp. NPDC050712]|uniref:hypothetical protein n=1 Tax=Nocardia sp. NPDC050712 TaxID=3155518 RepID=UPI0033FB9F2F